MARDSAPRKAKAEPHWCGLLVAKVVLCVMNVASFALAAGLVAVGSKKARWFRTLASRHQKCVWLTLALHR